jgi:hypothetical protein
MIDLAQFADVVRAQFAERKFEDTDVRSHPEWNMLAINWAREQYKHGATGFVESVVVQGEKSGRVSVGQVRGLLNCIRAEVLREQRVATSAGTQVADIDLSKLPAGNYRYAVPNESGGITFFRLDSVERDPRWAGWVFVTQVVGGGNDIKVGSHRPGVGFKFAPTLRNQAGYLNLIKRVMDDPKTAMLLYGKELGKCGHCNRTLTNAESRERGIGPVCAGHFGW